MIDGRDHARFAVEALAEILARYFDGDCAIQPGIARPVYLTHTSGADRSENFVGAEMGTGKEGHGAYQGL
jgi:hypothetical protein